MAIHLSLFAGFSFDVEDQQNFFCILRFSVMGVSQEPKLSMKIFKYDSKTYLENLSLKLETPTFPNTLQKCQGLHTQPETSYHCLQL